MDSEYVDFFEMLLILAGSGWMWTLLINNICVSVSLYFIVLFYQGFLDINLILMRTSHQASTEALPPSTQVHGDKGDSIFLLLAEYSLIDVCFDTGSHISRLVTNTDCCNITSMFTSTELISSYNFRTSSFALKCCFLLCYTFLPSPTRSTKLRQ